jgi:hypothetical protein
VAGRAFAPPCANINANDNARRARIWKVLSG